MKPRDLSKKFNQLTKLYENERQIKLLARWCRKWMLHARILDESPLERFKYVIHFQGVFHVTWARLRSESETGP